jgi:general secretion pathway protein K
VARTLPPSFSRQRGLALITAVLVVAIVATVAAYLALGQQVWLRQTQNLADRAQSESLRQAALDWIALLLARDAQQNKVDDLGELWAKQLPPLPAEGGLIAVSISDAQGLFNLNNLLRNGNPSPPDITVFQHLLTALGLDSNLYGALIDWMDANSDLSPGGAEDVDYLALPHPYRAANQPLTSVDELRLVRGFTPDVVEKLRPYVTVLPQPTSININTAVDQVMAAMFTNLPASALQPLLQNRISQPFTDNSQLMQRLPAGTPPPQAAYGVNTSYFLVTLDVRVGGLQRRSEALIFRPYGKPATVVWHRQNVLQPETKADENG